MQEPGRGHRFLGPTGAPFGPRWFEGVREALPIAFRRTVSPTALKVSLTDERCLPSIRLVSGLSAGADPGVTEAVQKGALPEGAS